jgi:hypothetical protein
MNTFWAQFAQADCMPKCGCEALGSGLIMQPIAFWSSFAYLLSAYFLYRRIQNRTLKLKIFVGLLTYLCFSSLFAHASFIKIALAMDFSSIVVLISFFPAYNLLTMLKRTPAQIIGWITLYVLSLVSVLYFISGWPRIILCLLIFLFALGDLFRERRKDLMSSRSRSFWQFLSIMFLSFCTFIVDTSHMICEPDGLIHGHMFWHFGTALGTYFFGRWSFHLERRPKSSAS